MDRWTNRIINPIHANTAAYWRKTPVIYSVKSSEVRSKNYCRHENTVECWCRSFITCCQLPSSLFVYMTLFDHIKTRRFFWNWTLGILLVSSMINKWILLRTSKREIVNWLIFDMERKGRTEPRHLNWVDLHMSKRVWQDQDYQPPTKPGDIRAP